MKTKKWGFLLTLLFASCTDDIQHLAIDNNQLSTLAFLSYTQFENVMSNIYLISDTEFEQWEAKNSFKSYRSVLKEAREEWDAVTSPEEQAAFEKKFQDILTVADHSIVPTIPIVAYQSIVNRQGIYQTGDHLHRIIGNYIATVKKDDFEKLRSLTLQNNQPKEKDGVRFTQFVNEGKLSGSNIRTAACSGPGNVSAEYYYNPSGCNNDRKVYLFMSTYTNLFTGYSTYNGETRYGDYYQAALEVRVQGDKRNSLCNWNNYQTVLEIKDVSVNALGAIHVSYEPDWEIYTFTIFNDIAIPDWSGNAYWWGFGLRYGDVIFNGNIGSSHIIVDAYGLGGSQGVGAGNYATIDCH